MASTNTFDQYEDVGWATAKDVNCTHYDRLGLDPGQAYTREQVDFAYTQRYNWWKQRQSQRDSGAADSNPLVKKTRDHFKPAFTNLLAAKDCLSDPDKKRVYDRELSAKQAQLREEPFLRIVCFTLKDKVLTPSEKQALLDQAQELGIGRERAQALIWDEMRKTGSREGTEPPSTGSGTQHGDSSHQPESDPPELKINPTRSPPLGTLRKGEKRELLFTIDNTGGGTLQGHFTTSHPEWLQVSPSKIIERRHHQEVKVTLDTRKLALGESYTGEVTVHSNGGTQTFTVEFSVEIEEAALARFRKALFLLGFFGAGVFGYLLYHFLPGGPSRDGIAGLAGVVGILAAIVLGGRTSGFNGGFWGLVLDTDSGFASEAVA